MKEQIDYGFLNTQMDPRFADRKFGRFGTMAKNGCGIIALYNVERAANNNVQFEPFYDARKQIKTNLFGALGTRPSSISKHLKGKGMQVTRIHIDQVSRAPFYDSIIVLYWYWFGAHYVAGIADKENSYTFYNAFTSPVSMTLEDYIAYLKRNKYHTVRIWGIRFPRENDA